MPDEGVDLGYCEECGHFGEIIYVDTPGPTKADQYHQSMYCKLHVREPLILSNVDFDMIYEKAGVPGPRRHRKLESIMGVLFFSKKHYYQVKRELGI